MRNVTLHDAADLFLSMRAEPESLWEERLAPYDQNVREEVLALLRHDREPHALLLDIEQVAESMREWSPEYIGDFKVCRRIGQGGAGVVFEAIEPALGRRVAIKALLPANHSRSSLRRFEQEAWTLARLDHPGIAKIFQVGASREGSLFVPFIVMELVDGQPLSTFVRQTDLDRTRRLELLASICDAVQHAHQRGILHRDLKPSNILVDAAGAPRVLDFGIAMLLQREGNGNTATGEVLGTPPYMSPEQARGDRKHVDTRSDVYSLGILILETLTYSRHERDGASPRLGRHADGSLQTPRDLGGDIEAIVRKATSPQSDNRYASVSELAADLRRAARREPVHARRYGPLQRAAAALRQNKALAFAVSAIVLGASLAVWQSLRAQAGVQELKDMLYFACEYPDASVLDDRRCGELLTRVKSLDLGDTPRSAAVKMYFGERSRFWGPLSREVANGLLKDAVETFIHTLGPNDPKTLAAKIALSNSYTNDGHYQEAKDEAIAVLDVVRGVPDKEPLEASAKLALAAAYSMLYQHQNAIEVYESILRDNSSDLLTARSFYGQSLLLAGRGEEGKACLRKAIEELKETDSDRYLLAMTIDSLAVYVAFREGNLAEGERLLDEETSTTQRLDHGRLMEMNSYECSLARFQWAKGDFVTCIQTLTSVLDRNEGRSIIDISALDDTRNMLGVCLRDTKQYDKAEPILREVLKSRTRRIGEFSAPVSNSQINLARLLVRTGRSQEALDLCLKAKETRSNVFGATSAETLETIALEGQIRASMGHIDEGLALARGAAESRTGELRKQWIANLALETYAETLVQLGRVEEASNLLAKELSELTTSFGTEHLSTIRCRNLISRLLPKSPAGGTTLQPPR